MKKISPESAITQVNAQVLSIAIAAGILRSGNLEPDVDQQSNRYRSAQWLWLIGVMWCMATGCSSYHATYLPSWVINPPSRCAMGSMRSQSSLSLTKLGAMTRGRAALSHQIKSRMVGVIRSYIAEGEDLKGQVSEEMFIDHSVQSTESILQGTQAREIFISSDPYQTLYALVCINESQVAKIFKDLSFLPSEHRGPLRQRAREAFVELDRLISDAPNATQ